MLELAPLLVSALIGNNNTSASPKWDLISPEAIGRIAEYLESIRA